MSYLDGRLRTDMHASDRKLAVHDRHSISPHVNVNAWFKLSLHCSGCSTLVLHSVRLTMACPFFPCYEEFEYEKELWSLVWPYFHEQLLPKAGPWLIVMLCPFSYLYYAERLNYWNLWLWLSISSPLACKGIFAGRQNVQSFIIPPSHCSIHYVHTKGFCWELEGFWLLCVPMPLSVAGFYGYIINHSVC